MLSRNHSVALRARDVNVFLSGNIIVIFVWFSGKFNALYCARVSLLIGRKLPTKIVAYIPKS